MSSSAEYTALLGLVAAGLAGTGAVVGVDAIGSAVADGVRTGICIVAGDVCRASDAEAAGLAPCMVAEHARGQGLALTIASVRFGADDEWSAARRSDGSVLVTHAEERGVGAVAGIGFEASPLGVEVGVDGKLDYRLGSGRSWEFVDAESAARFLKAADREEREPTWRFGDAGTVLVGEASVQAGPFALAGLESTARAAAGVRVGRGLTTYYVRTRLDALDATHLSPRGEARIEGPSTGDAIVELTRDAAGPRELAFRTVRRGTQERLVETVARLDLRDPGHLAAAEHGDLRALVARAVRSGIVERSVYDVRDGSQELELGVKLGLALGVQGEEVDVDRTLVAATAWTEGSAARERADCGVTGEPPEGT